MDEPCNLRSLLTGSTPGQVSASLFLQLAKFLVWGQQNQELSAAYPDLALLLKSTEVALACSGCSEHEELCSPQEISG